MARVLNWNGKDLPEELKSLPAGRYVLERVDDEVPVLSPEEEEGIREALRSLHRGEGKSLDEVRDTISRALKK